MDEAVNSIINALKAIFVPDEDYLSDKVNSIRSKFAIADSVISLSDYFGNQLGSIGNASQAPSLTINLSANNSKYEWGSEAVVLDLSWYEPYKPTVDALLSSILWVVFGWRLIVAAPGIINGVSGTFEMGQDLYYGNTYAGTDKSGANKFKTLRGGKRR